MMGHSKWMRPLGLSFLSALLLTGCWDRTEINDVAIVVGKAVDLDDDGNFRIGVQVPIVSLIGGPSGGGGGGNEKKYMIETETGETVREAIGKMQDRLPRQLRFSHRRIIVLGEEYARKGIRNLFDEVARVPDNRLTTHIVVTEGKALDMLSEKPKLERFSSEVIRELSKSRLVATLNLKDIAQMMVAEGADPIVLYMTNKKQRKDASSGISIAGYAVFRDDKMVDKIMGDSMFGISFLRNSYKNMSLTVRKDGAKSLTFMVDKGTTKLVPTIKDGQLHVKATIIIFANTLENQAIEDSSKIRVIETQEQALEDEIKRICSDVLEVMKKQRTDILSLGQNLYRRDPKTWKSIHNDWDHYLSNMTYSIEVKSRVGNIGLISENIGSPSE
jgi:spore germination protein KC